MTAARPPAPPPPGRVPSAPRRVAPGLGLGVIGVMVMGAGVPAQALPPDPQRPFDATTCDAALARLEEACAGSPLIPPETAAAVLEQARAQALRLCGEPAALPHGLRACAPRDDDSSQR